jgi:hypothetical protein
LLLHNFLKLSHLLDRLLLGLVCSNVFENVLKHFNVLFAFPLLLLLLKPFILLAFSFKSGLLFSLLIFKL